MRYFTIEISLFGTASFKSYFNRHLPGCIANSLALESYSCCHTRKPKFRSCSSRRRLRSVHKLIDAQAIWSAANFGRIAFTLHITRRWICGWTVTIHKCISTVWHIVSLDQSREEQFSTHSTRARIQYPRRQYSSRAGDSNQRKVLLSSGRQKGWGS